MWQKGKLDRFQVEEEFDVIFLTVTVQVYIEGVKRSL